MILPRSIPAFWLSIAFACLPACSPIANAASSTEDLLFNRDVRPILAKHCFACHGPDEDARESDLRLDEANSATIDRGGYRAVDPGRPDQSEILVRVLSDDEDLRMPPAATHPPLTDREIETLRRWIAGGGRYDEHWAFVPPGHVSVPAIDADENDFPRPQSPIDALLVDAWKNDDQSVAPECNSEVWRRRLHFRLTGLPPDLADAIGADTDPTWRHRMVDRLLADPRYGEHWARSWLDLARYADTNGYEKDRPRTMWPYRDWVIDAINADMPFDQFSIEQLAGDLLPKPTIDQWIATGFHRNTMLNEEGGIDPNEYRFYSVVDRVAVTGTVWMGLTTGCAQCHTHKYDPITHDDYYAMFALLNDADEPNMVVPDAQRDRQIERVETQIRQIIDRATSSRLPSRNEFVARGTTSTKTDEPDGSEELSSDHREFYRWVSDQRHRGGPWMAMSPIRLQSTMPILEVLTDHSIRAFGDVTKREVYELEFELPPDGHPYTAIRIEAMADDDLPGGGPGLAFYEGRQGDFFLSEATLGRGGEPVRMLDPSTDASGNGVAAKVLDGDGSTGWSGMRESGRDGEWIANFETPVDGGIVRLTLLFERHYAAGLGRFRISFASGTDHRRASSALDDATLRSLELGSVDDEVYRKMQTAFVVASPLFQAEQEVIDRLRERIPKPLRAMVMRGRPTEHGRVTHRHHRGEYLQPRETVTPHVPVKFDSPHADDPSSARPFAPSSVSDRLELARWLVSPANPMGDRVQVNRAWRGIFGRGLVDTDGDFGTQSRLPKYPELLDHLALGWRRAGMSNKWLHRELVLSAVFARAGGDPVPEAAEESFSHYPTTRASGEMIRDRWLHTAGLLSSKVGGPSVYPPQPASVTAMAYGAPKWDTSQGEDRYRRSLYTFAKRTSPFAALSTFDGPSGELCLARRAQSTTPLQALTLLNDPMFLELSEATARRVLETAARDDRDPIEQAFRGILGRLPTKTERQRCQKFVTSLSPHSPSPEDSRPWMLLCRALLNTDEALVVP